MPPVKITIEENTPTYLSPDAFSWTVAEALRSRFPGRIGFEPPSPFNQNQWVLRSSGYVGFFYLTPDLLFHLLPKVPANVFRMLEVAYRTPLQQEQGSIVVESMEEVYERLAKVLGMRVRDRARQGFYRTYEQFNETLPYLRERTDLTQMMRRPWKTNFDCEYHDNTADIPDNQILTWTLETILRSGLCRSDVFSTVNHAYREISNLTSVVPFRAQDCVNRKYNRLNQDYSLLHGLCRFFLENTGPGYKSGERTLFPFLIDMAVLFEQFVAEWLNQKLGQDWLLKPQETVPLDAELNLMYRIDLVLAEARTGRVRCVLDTKYKKPEQPGYDDINQVVAYAVSQGCKEAVLIYPSALTRSISIMVGDIH
ncbi:MAG TPA: hypothetical protein PJ988_23420, partial [Anaerolinea sp.]|nr:hypothetical protein [Anaerolinea sp.]